MVGQKTSILNRKGLVLWLIGFTILYQVVYQMFIMHALQQQPSDGECSEEYHLGLSPHCAEVQLFRTWQTQAPRTEVLGPEVDFGAEHLEFVTQPPAPANATSSDVQETQEQSLHTYFEARRQSLLERHVRQEEDLMLKLQSSNMSDAQGVLTSWVRDLVDLRQHLEAHEFQAIAADLRNSTVLRNQTEAYDENETVALTRKLSASTQTHKAWEDDFVGRAQQIWRELCNDPQRQGRKACMGALVGDAAHRPEGSATLEERLSVAGNNSAAWSRTFMTVVREAQRDMCREPHRRGRQDCIELMASAAKAEQAESVEYERESALWSHTFKTALWEIQREMCEEPHRRNREDCVQLMASVTQSQQREAAESTQDAASPAVDEVFDALYAVEGKDFREWSRTFNKALREAQRELCQEPRRGDRKDCIQLMASITKAEHLEVVAAEQDSAAWSHNFMHKVRVAQKEMCQEPHRHNRSDCLELLASIADEEKREEEESRSRLAAGDALTANITAEAARWEEAFQQGVLHSGPMSDEIMRQVQDTQRESVELLASLAEADDNRASGNSSAVLGVANIANVTAEAAHWDVAFQQMALDSESWSRDFMRKVRAVQREMCNEPHRRNRSDCTELLASIEDAETHESQEIGSKRATGAALRDNVTAEAAQWDEIFQQMALDSASWSHNFTHKVRGVQREMCHEPHRRNRSDCVQLLASIAEEEKREAEEHRTRLAARAALRTNIEAEATQWDAKSMGQSADRTAAALADTGHTSLRQGRRPLHWSDATAWSSTGWLKGNFGSRRGRLLLDRRELDAAQWAGMIPKVACITAFHSGPLAASQMKYFIDRFRRQTYEGPSQLILVYHYKDTEAADLARLYADGSYIKAVASRDNGEFPSTVALRFGSWSADDAEVVVHWDFDGWHRPQRLSLQVRALAYSGRPACLLKEADASEGSIQEETLAGEAKWMQKNWHPLLGNQLAILQGMQEDQIVQVNMAMDGGRQDSGRFAAIRNSMDKHFARLAGLLGSPVAEGAK